MFSIRPLRISCIFSPDDTTILQAEDLGSIRQRIRKAFDEENGFLPYLIDLCILQFNASRSVDQTVSVLNSNLDLITHRVELRYTRLRDLVWVIPTFGFIGTYHPEALATSIAFAPNGRSAVSGSREGTAQLWNTATQFLNSIIEIGTLVYLLPVDGGGPILFDNNSTTTKPIRTIDIKSSTIVALACGPGGDVVASGDTFGYIKVWRLDTGEEQNTT